MAIQKKSLISTLKTTKKANVAKEVAGATNDGVATRKIKIATKKTDFRMRQV